MVNALKVGLGCALVAASVGTGAAQGRTQIGLCDTDDGKGSCDTYGTHLWTSTGKSQMKMQCVEEGMFALTFHGGPDASTAELLPKLRAAGIRATFFISGHMLGDDANLAILKQIEEDGHVLAMNGHTTYGIGDLSYPGGTSGQHLFDSEITAMKNIVTPLTYGFFGAYTPKYGSITLDNFGNSDAVDVFGYNGVRTVWPSLNYESEPEGGEITNEQHITSLYGDPNYRAEQDARFDAMMDALIDNDKPHSFIASMAASQVGSKDWLDRVIVSLNERPYYTTVDIRTCLGIPLEKGAYDMRAQACMASECDTKTMCKNENRQCEHAYCSGDDIMWKPECLIDISLGEAIEVEPVKEACSGEPCPVITECRGQDDTCAVGFCNEGMDPIWTTACPLPAFPLEECGEACVDTTQCRRASDTLCGAGWEFCSATSLWTPSCVEEEESTPSPTSKPTEDAGEPGLAGDWLCTGAPCESENECRSQVTFKCGTSPEYCNADSVWTDLCSEKDTSGASQLTLSFTTTFSLSALALLASRAL